MSETTSLRHNSILSRRTDGIKTNDGYLSNSFNENRISNDSADVEMKVPPIITKFFKQLHQGLFGLLFALQKKSDDQESRILFYIRELFELLQLLSFPFRSKADFQWNPEHTEWFVTFVNSTVPENVLEGLTMMSLLYYGLIKLGNLTVFYVVIFCLALVLLNAGVVGYFFAQNKYRFVWTLPYLRFVCTLFVTILYIPVVGLFASMMISCGESSHGILEDHCWSDLYAVRSSLVLIIGIIYAALSLVFCLSVFQQNPTDTSELLSRSHSRIEMYQLLVKTCLSVSFVFFEHYSSLKWLLVILCLVSSCSTLWAYVWFIPNYRWHYHMVRVYAYTIFFWASICLFITVLIDDHNNSVSIMFFVLSPLILILASYAALIRKNWIKKAVIKESTSPYTVELKARFMLEDAGYLFKNAETLQSTLTTHEDTAAHAKVLVDISGLYSQAISLFPNSSVLYMFWSNFSLYHCQNKQRSLILLAECEKRRPSLDERFVIYRQRRLMNDEKSSENTDMIDFIISESYMKKATKHEEKAVFLQLQFWSELNRKTCDLNKLLNLGARINAEVGLADMNYTKAISRSIGSVSVIREYAKFLGDVCNDIVKSEEYQERANQIEEIKRKSQLIGGRMADISRMMTDVSSLDTDAVLITIDHKGCIISANNAVKNLFGYENPQMIVGENINVLIPPPLDRLHDMFLERYMNVGEGVIISKVRKLFGVHANGYIIPVMLLVRQLTFGTKATFLGIFRPVPEGISAYSYIILDNHGFIKGFTEKCSTYFGGFPGDVSRYQLHINQWISNFFEIVDSLRESKGYKLKIYNGDKEFELVVTMASVTIFGTEMSIIRLVEATDKLFRNLRANEEIDLRNGIPMTFYTADSHICSHASKPDPDQSASAKNSRPPSRTASLLSNNSVELDNSSRMLLARNDSFQSNRSNDERRKRMDSKLSQNSQKNNADALSQKTSDSRSNFTMNRFIRSNFTKRIETSTSRLETLRRATVFLFCCIMALCIFINIYINAAYQSYITCLDDIISIGDNLANSILVLDNLRTFDEKRFNMSLTDREVLRDQTKDVIANISQTHQILIKNSFQFGGELLALYTQSNNSVLSDSANRIFINNISVNDAMSYFVSQASIIASELVDLSKDVDLESLSSVFLDTLSDSVLNILQMYLKTSVDMSNRLPNQIFYTSIFPILLINSLILLFLVGSYMGAYGDSKLLYNLFLDIPKEIISELHHKCLRKLISINTEENNSWADEQRTKIFETFDIQNFIQNKVVRSSLRSSKTEMDGGETVREESESHNFKKLLFRMAIVSFISFAYFVSFALTADYFIQRNQLAPKYLAWAGRTWYSVLDSHYRTATLQSNLSISLNDTTNLLKSQNLLHSLFLVRNSYDDLYYGNDAFLLKPMLVEFLSKGTFTLENTYILPLLVDEISAIDNNSDQCQSIFHGLLGHGLLNSITQYAELGLDVYAVSLYQNFTSTFNLSQYSPTSSQSKIATQCLPDSFAALKSELITPVMDLYTQINLYAHIPATIFVILFIAIFYKTSIGALLKDMKHEATLSPSMLLMIPPQVLMKVESIRNFFDLDKYGKN